MIKQRLHMTPFIICYGLYLISCVIYVLNQIIKYDFFENLKHESIMSSIRIGHRFEPYQSRLQGKINHY